MADVEMYINPNFGDDESIYLADVAVAKIPGVKAAVLDAALDRAAIAESILAANRRTGNSFIEVSMAGEPDVLVSIVDPRVGTHQGGAAMGIERGTGALSSAFGIDPIRDLLRDGDTGYSFVRGD